jgi:cytochrome c-type biogenesis protein CcmE
VTESETTSPAQAQGRRTGARRRLIIGGAIIVAVIGWLIYSNIGGSSTHYLSVAEVMAEGPSDRIVRATGIVIGQTIDWNPQQLLLRFDIEDESGSLPVVYNGPRPDLLEDGTQAVVEGKYRATGVFEANSVLLKCPSKYAEE